MAGKPHCGQVPIRHCSERVQTEQMPQALRASGILHSQHKPGTVSMFNLHVKKENSNG
ncbi:hypothetical protein OUHCRE11_36780 [Enterobacter asburiae]|nr:hypothetical protein ENTKAS01_00530 [Enterobacter sp. AS-1]